MANYIEDFNSKLDWAMPFQRTSKFPLDRSGMFSTYADAVAYAKGDGSDSRGLGGTSYVGQLIVVFENDNVIVYKINADRTIEALTSKNTVDSLNSSISKSNGNFTVDIEQTNGLLNSMSISDIKLSDNYVQVTYPETDSTVFTPTSIGDTLDIAVNKLEQNVATLVQEVLNNEEVIAAAITKHNESAGFDENANYVVDSTSTHISGATTLSEADTLLSYALDAEIAARKAAIESLNSSSSTDLTEETDARKAIDGQSGKTYAANTSSTYISAATSLNDADIKLSEAIENLSLISVSGDELSSLGTNVREAYKLIDGNSSRHGDYIKIYKDSSLQNVVFENQTLKFTYVLSDGSATEVPVDVSAFLTEEEYSNGLQVIDHVISVKVDETSESFLSVGTDGIKLSGVQTAINTAVTDLDSDITSDDVALVTVQVKQTDGVISDVIVTGNDIDCGTF